MRKKKKFIDKKRSATFQLVARDTSDPNYSSGLSGDCAFVRVDHNHYTPEFLYGEDNERVIEARGDEDENDAGGGVCKYRAQTTPLPDQIRKEILELGFPGDGYDYLAHLREIKSTGGSTYYHNHKAKSGQLPLDVKASDASMVEVSKISDVSEERSMYSVASKMAGARLEKEVDPELIAMLDELDSSDIGSDVEDLEEDFVINANLLEDEDDDEQEAFVESKSSLKSEQANERRNERALQV